AANHPAAEATDPTSETGTRIASPKNMHAAVARPTHRTATDGVWFLGWISETRRSMSPRRPMANSRRLDATKFPLKTLNSESRADARITLTIHREPTACSNATAVMNFSPDSWRHGATYPTAAITMV